MMKYSALLLLLSIFLILVSTSTAQNNNNNNNNGGEQGSGTSKQEYYDLVEEVLTGVNHYEVLQISPEAKLKEIKKSFHTLSLTYHPDKIKSNFATKTEQEEALKQYYKIQRAYTVLSTPELRELYDELLVNGIPWQDQHYHRYVHKYWRGAPEHDLFNVLFYFVLAMSIFHYYYVRHRYKRLVNFAKRTTKYKTYVKKLDTQKKDSKTTLNKRTNSEIDNNSEDNEDNGEEFEDEPKVVFSGLNEPKWYEILPIVVVITLYKFIKSLFKFVVSMIYRNKLTPEEQEEEYKKMICEKYGWSEEEYQLQKERSIRRQQQLMNSTKMKRYMRYKKKYGLK